MITNEEERLNVYFNSACPVCSIGINSQKTKSTACKIQWQDVHTDNSLVAEIDSDLKTVRKYLHVSNQNQQQHIGINAFITLWQNSPKEKWKAKLFSLPIINQLSQLAYFVFANCLYAWNKYKKHW